MEKQVNELKNDELNNLNTIEKDMLSTVISIKKELKKRYSENSKEFYIYSRYNENIQSFKIFVKLLKESKINKRLFDIYFLININYEYPQKPPIVNCLTDFGFPTFCDGSDLITNIIPNWTSINSVYDIINYFPKFLNTFEFERNNKLLSTYGTYSINSQIYNINDFLINTIIQFINIEVCIKTPNGLIFEPRYLFIIDNHLIIFHNIDEKKRYLCVISFYAEIQTIEKISKTTIDDVKLNEKSCFKIIWEQGANNVYNDIISVSQDKINYVIDLIMEKKNSLKYKFDLFYNNNLNNIEQIEKIIDIKEKILEKENDENIFKSIIELYQKIIEIITIKNDDGFQIYMNKLHKMIEKYNVYTKK